MNNRVVIIGAGIVGVSTALWLQRDGFKVSLIDKAGPAEGTSYGNGGVLASCGGQAAPLGCSPHTAIRTYRTLSHAPLHVAARSRIFCY